MSECSDCAKSCLSSTLILLPVPGAPFLCQVAMVPSPNSPQTPCFPQGLYWLLDDQLYDGSWSLPNRHPLLTKDAISSTLACVLALRQWGIGEEQMERGLQFIESNFASVKDKNQYTPIGFEIIFSAMIEYAKDLNLNLPSRSTDRDALLPKRDLEHQRKNGSLFNSPSMTAAALAYLQNDACLYYLHTVLQKFGNAVPTIYPFNIHAHLCMVETVESLGINWHFREEINNVLDEIYGCWQQGQEDIFLDLATCAMAFQIVRNNRYNVSSAPTLALHCWGGIAYAAEGSLFNQSPDIMLAGYFCIAVVGCALPYDARGPIVLPALYFVGPRLSEEVVKSTEYNDLFKLVGTCGIFSMIVGASRESKQGKLNAVPLRMIHGPADVTEEDTIKEINSYIHDRTRELLILDLQGNGSMVPRACKDLFWNLCKVMHLFYMKDDGYNFA
ncbi:hypothetical protein SLEP1_g18638 [Rubroshorea leprosula]|uniref:Terpene synthase N-terminal domain-containing protein n=1 Tax=Rubroshorea leprosula TaxID=152421 RepID=A0AAV5IY85_9ROSI|nr:hypothetical protein SLEP1_g18638 [Rubroshorea leprosula]